MNYRTTTRTTNGTLAVENLTLVQVSCKIAALSANGNRPVVSERIANDRTETDFAFADGAVATLTVIGATAAQIRADYRNSQTTGDGLEVCGRCGGNGGWEGWPGFTCFRCRGRGRCSAATNAAGERGMAEMAMAALRGDLARAGRELIACATCGRAIGDDVTYANSTLRHCADCSEDLVSEIEAEAAADTAAAQATQPLVLNDGTYTLVYGNDEYFTFRIRTATRGNLAGRRIAEYLSGPSNELDFQAFAFVNASSLNVWSRFERGPLVNRAREIEVMAHNDREGMEAAGLRYAERSSRCRRCNKVLTVPTSLAAGYGPDCAALLGVAYAQPTTETTRRARRSTTAAPTVELDADTCVQCGGEGCDVCNETGRVVRSAQAA